MSVHNIAEQLAAMLGKPGGIATLDKEGKCQQVSALLENANGGIRITKNPRLTALDANNRPLGYIILGDSLSYSVRVTIATGNFQRQYNSNPEIASLADAAAAYGAYFAGYIGATANILTISGTVTTRHNIGFSAPFGAPITVGMFVRVRVGKVMFLNRWGPQIKADGQWHFVRKFFPNTFGNGGILLGYIGVGFLHIDPGPCDLDIFMPQARIGLADAKRWGLGYYPLATNDPWRE